MKLRTLVIVGLFSAAQAATAALTPGTGGGYYGSAWYNSGQGSVVGPYPTYQQCQTALQNALNNAVYNFGWSIVSVDYCHYNPPAPMVMHELSPVEGLDYVGGIMHEIEAARAGN